MAATVGGLLTEPRIQLRMSSSSFAVNRHFNVFPLPPPPPPTRRHFSVKAVSTPVKPGSETKRSKVEIIKEHSNYIRYPLNEELLTDAPNVNESAVQLIKFHGSYQQYNREGRGPESHFRNPSDESSNEGVRRAPSGRTRDLQAPSSASEGGHEAFPVF